MCQPAATILCETEVHEGRQKHENQISFRSGRSDVVHNRRNGPSLQPVDDGTNKHAPVLHHGLHDAEQGRLAPCCERSSDTVAVVTGYYLRWKFKNGLIRSEQPLADVRWLTIGSPPSLPLLCAVLWLASVVYDGCELRVQLPFVF